MSATPDVIVVGAGLAGLACARTLSDAGQSVQVLDKGRGIGGRMATRRVVLDGATLRFDHGAQYVTAYDPGFAALLADAARAGAAAVWDETGPRLRHTGVPGMSALPRHLAAGLAVTQGTTVTALRPGPGGWALQTSAGTMTAPRLVLAIPAPQAAALLGGAHALSGALDGVAMAPCLTLMAAFPAGPAAHMPPDTLFETDADHPLAWIARDSSKPGRALPGAGRGAGGRAGITGWVAQASLEWSAQHLEDSVAQIAARMLPLLAARLGLDPAEALHASAHRWRYARVARPLGTAFLADAPARLWLGGDWCLAARAEAAWQSGRAMATDILARG
ncbi:FAD-dependent oxidoreductase [Rhodobacteraceae bacterium 2376]|uniref:FAD-dependent oxidoreductase n=1 Tax=Rhabdonatronobacter sediminivivens TaxID=2743469 RepID=A0A7Z0L2H6_9RHOB|nr:FAD-dependent oxidoreductase [Rhabdonatronobacter sediminivivens]NYS26468.1 FAD-dependent oxidoreductase [Rhabdonatronobacter sediminivivens]